MGEAEDIIFERRRRRKEEKEQARGQRIQILDRQLRELIPQAVASLRRHNYPDSPSGFTTFRVADEERAAWRIHSGRVSYDRIIYLLADGQLARKSGTTYTIEEVAASSTDDGEANSIIEKLREIIDYTPKRE